MHRLLHITALSVAVLAGLGATANATTYNEGTQGDLSGSGDVPTNMGALTLGDNFIIGSTIPSGSPIPDGHGALANQDNDFVTFTVPVGYQIDQFDVAKDTSINLGDRLFLGLYPGDTTSVDPTNPTPAGLLGYSLPGAPQIGTDILPAIEAADEPGFPTLPTNITGSLGPGEYTLWLVDGDSPVHYDLDLRVSAAPEPSAWMLLTAGVGLMGVMLRRRAGRAIQAGVA